MAERKEGFLGKKGRGVWWKKRAREGGKRGSLYLHSWDDRDGKGKVVHIKTRPTPAPHSHAKRDDYNAIFHWKKLTDGTSLASPPRSNRSS